jgi:hypothetical protein
MLDALSRSAGRYRGIAVVRNDTGVGEPRTSKAAASVCFLTIAAGHPKCRSGTARFRRTACIGRNTARLCEAIELGQIVRYAISSLQRVAVRQGTAGHVQSARTRLGVRWPFFRSRERIDYGPLLALMERLVPDANARRAIFWDTPTRLFGFQCIVDLAFHRPVV